MLSDRPMRVYNKSAVKYNTYLAEIGLIKKQVGLPDGDATHLGEHQGAELDGVGLIGGHGERLGEDLGALAPLYHLMKAGLGPGVLLSRFHLLDQLAVAVALVAELALFGIQETLDLRD